MGDNARDNAAIGPDVEAEAEKCRDFLQNFAYMGNYKYLDQLVSLLLARAR